METPPAHIDSEIASVLFLDIAGYSVLPMEEQARAIGRLREIVRIAAEFRRADSAGELLSLDTGDGMALVFFRSGVGPAKCATEIASALGPASSLRVRMGIHTGPVSRAADLNARENVSGGGINIAQRVMAAAEPGQILLSRAAADILADFAEWRDRLVDLGEAVAKHGQRLHLFRLVGVGEPPVEAPKSTGPQSRAAVSPGNGRVVAVLYKRNAQPDAYVLSLLERQLAAAGFKVFVDRHLAIGVEWANEIERQVRGAFAVVPLLSAAALGSEMLEYELEVAHHAAQQQGTPRIFPLRIGFSGDLPAGSVIESIVGRLQYTLWEGPQDDDRVVSELLDALRNPPRARSERLRHEAVGGAVPLDSEFYIVRPTDHEFRSAIDDRDSIVLVKGARQMGKTSLLARGLQQARESGAKVVFTDLQCFNQAHLETIDAFYLSLAEAIAYQLDLEATPSDTWQTRLGANVNLERFLRRSVLDKIETSLVWGLDEVDRLFACPFGSEVFGLFRSWHNRRSLEPTGPWSKLSLVIAYATEAHLFISDPNQSPFNVGTRLTLHDFTLDQVSELNQRYDSPLATPSELRDMYELLSGHPYLTRRGLSELATRGTSFAEFAAGAGQDEGPFGDHLRRLLVMLSQNAQMLGIIRGLLRGEPCPTTESFFRLRSGGVVIGESAQDARFRCRLYRDYLGRHVR